MCRGLVSCADFKTILTPFSEVIWNRYSSFSKNGKVDLSVHRWPDVTPQIAFSSTGKVPNCNKNNSSIKPNKFHSKCVCFGGWKTSEERKICFKIHLFSFLETLVMRHATTAARNVVSFSTVISPFEFWARAQIQWLLALALKFKWTNQSWEWNHVASCRCRMPHHKGLRKAEEVNLKANFSFFTSLSAAELTSRWNCYCYCDSGLFLLSRKRFVEWRLASDVRSGLPFASFRRSNSFK